MRGRNVLLAGLHVLGLLLRLLLFARIERLRLARRERLAADGRLVVVAFVVAVIAVADVTLAALVIRRALAELFLRGGDQPEIVFGVLVVILRRHRIARTLRVACKLKICFSNMRSGAPDFYVRSIGLIHTGQRILVVMTALAVVATTHSLVVVVLTVSHVAFRQPFICGGMRRRC